MPRPVASRHTPRHARDGWRGRVVSNARAAVRRGWFARVARWLLLAIGAAAMLLPFADTLLGALRTPAELLARPVAYWPATPAWGNFARVFTDTPMLLWIGNSLLVSSIITVVQLVTSVMAGFALAKYRFPGREIVLRLVLAAQMVPFFLLVVPAFLIARAWPLAGGNDWFGQGGSGLLGGYAGLVLPFAVSWYGIFLMRQFIMSVPDALLDAARLDGASELRVLAQIVLPLIRPVLATLAIFVFVYQWNEIIWTMTVTRVTPALQTAPVGIYLMRDAFDDVTQLPLQQAAIAISTAPVLILFLLLQRQYVRGASLAGVKG